MAANAIYDVFLSYASKDAPAVEALAHRLMRAKIRPFLDKWHLVPGEPWQEALEEALDLSRTSALFLGQSPGPWLNEEMSTALTHRLQHRGYRVIPVLLPGAEIPKNEMLPRFLRRLTWVDFRSGLDDQDAFRRLVSGIRGVAPGPPAAARMIGVPPRNPFFTGRETLLSRMHEQLQKQGTSALAQASIYGRGGIGKTQTAIEYAHRFGEQYQFVLWVLADGEAAIRAGYLSIAHALELVEAQADLERAVLAMKNWLSREDDWLLVFDAADDPALVRTYLPPRRAGGKVLLTSRAKSFAKIGIREPLRVETLEHEEAVKFLIERTGNTEVEDASVPTAAAALAAELDYFPLALALAAAYIESAGSSLAKYLSQYRRKSIALFENGKPGTEYLNTVATTWTLSFTAVREASPASAELLTVAAFLEPDSVPIEIFTRGGSQLGTLLARHLRNAKEDSLAFWELLEPLERYSLVERLPDKMFKLHPFTQEMVRNSLEEKDRRAWAKRAVRALNAAYPDVEFASWTLCERLQPNARRASELTRTYKLESTETGRLFSAAGHFASVEGDHAGAKLLNELSLKIYSDVLGSEHPNTWTVRINLAENLETLGDLIGARSLYEQSVRILERVLGAEHPNTLEVSNKLAGTLRALGDLTGARRMHEQNLKIYERVLGSEHPNTLTSRSNLAAVLQNLGNSAAAKKVHEQNLEIYERVLGSEHPNTLTSRSNLAATLQDLGDLSGAKRLHKQTLEARERVLGGEHPDTLVSRNSLRLVEWNLEIRTAVQDLTAARSTESHYQRRQSLARARKKLELTLDRLAGTKQLTQDEQHFFSVIKSLLDRVANEEAALAVLEREQPQVPLVFVAGVPLTPADEGLFMGRRDLVRLLDQDLATERPVPLVLLGQRRMGKSTLLNFLPRLLGAGTRVVRLDFQGLSGNPLRGEPHRWVAAEVAKALAGEEIGTAFPPPDETSWGATLDWLVALEGPLAAADRRLLIALDEVEGLERGIREGWSAPAFLDFLRAAGDRLLRSRFLLITAHPFSRLGPHWSDRLISAQTRRIKPLREEEARELLTRPLGTFNDIYPPRGIELLLTQTACHPYLLQLIAYALVWRLNNAGRLKATEEDLAAALDQALEENNLFQYLWDDLAPLEQRLMEALAYEEDPPEAVEEASETLSQARRELAQEQLIQRSGDRWKIAVPLFARWIREIGAAG